MKRLAKISSALAALALASCERGLTVKVAGAPSQPEFVLGPIGHAIFKTQYPSINEVWVEQVAPHQRVVVPIWHIKRVDDFCVPSPRFRYGATPEDWKEVTAQQPLNQDVQYVLRLHGCFINGERKFSILKGRVRRLP
jgi:hypothetical protein